METEQLIKNIEESGFQYFDCLAKSLKNCSDIGIGLIKHGYQAKCSGRINSILRAKSSTPTKEFLLIKEIERLINFSLEKKFTPLTSEVVWRHDWPSTSNNEQNLNVLNWFNQNISKTILFPSFLSTYSEKHRMPAEEYYFEINTLPLKTKAFDISKLIPNHPEAEILFQSNSKLKILAVNYDNFSIKLEETTDKEDYTLFEKELFFSLNIAQHK